MLSQVAKKLILVGFATIVMPGTLYQLLFAFMITLVHMLFLSIFQPYRALDNGLRAVRTCSLPTCRPIDSRPLSPFFLNAWQTTSPLHATSA